MADLTLAPDFVFVTSSKYDTIKTDFENGFEQRRNKRVFALHEWTLQFRNRSQADLTIIQSLFDAHLGSFQSFTWTNPLDGLDYGVRFKEDALSFQAVAYGLFDFTFDLVEVL